VIAILVWNVLGLNYQDTLSYNGHIRMHWQTEDLLTDVLKCGWWLMYHWGISIGGVDSSLIVALASRISNTKLKTFTVKFDEARLTKAIMLQLLRSLRNDHTTMNAIIKTNRPDTKISVFMMNRSAIHRQSLQCCFQSRPGNMLLWLKRWWRRWRLWL